MLTSRTVMGAIAERQRLYLTILDRRDSAVFDGLRALPDLKRGTYEIRTDSTGRAFTLVQLIQRDEATQERVVERGAVGDSVGRSVGLGWQPLPSALGPNRASRFSVIPPAAAAAQLKGRIHGRIIPKTSIMQVTLSGRDRFEVAPTLNAVIDEFVFTASDLQSRNDVINAERLRRQADSAGIALRAAEVELEQFRINTITQPTEAVPVTPGLQQTMSPVMQDYFGKKSQYDNLKQERAQLEQIHREIRAGNISATAFASISIAAQSRGLQQALTDLSGKEQQLRAARLTFTDEAGPVKALLNDIQTLRREQIPALSQELIDEMKRRERVLEGQLAAAGRELQGIPSRSIHEQSLQHKVSLAQNVYQQLVHQHQQLRVQAMVATNRGIAVLDTAVPPARATDDISLFILLGGFAGGLGLGLLGAILLDRLDKRFRYPEQATGELGLPIVGAVPRLRRDRGGAKDPEEAAQIIEAFRTIRMNLRYAFDGSGSISVAISSPGPGDGKSLVSLNLALSFAEAGYRTVLVDGDIRRGELHDAFETPIVRRPGLMDYLVGNVPLESVLRETGFENLTLVPCGTRRHRGPELLQSEGLNGFVETMRMRYDVVIMDTPPLAAGIDPFVLGAATGNLLLVLRTGETDRKLAQSRLALAQRLPIRVLGAVLNDIQAEGAYRYYSYLYGYSLDDDEGLTPRLSSSVGATGD
jgi:capsular exopolysaccharide synthesis family protein